MEDFVGNFDIDIKDTMFKSYTKIDFILYFIEYYGQFDGGQHKAWVLDQVARIAKDTKVIIKEARWADGYKEIRIFLDEPSQEYLDWVKEMKGDPNDPYDYDEGIAP
jgi:hypothetical protein